MAAEGRPLLETRAASDAADETEYQLCLFDLQDADSSAAAIDALKRLELLLVKAPSLRTRQAKQYVLDCGSEKRTSSTALWTREVAYQYRQVLQAFTLPEGEALPGAVSYGAPPEDSVESGGDGGDGGAAARDASKYSLHTSAATSASGASDSDPHGRAVPEERKLRRTVSGLVQPALFDLPVRQRRLLIYCAVLAIFFLSICLVAVVRSRKLGVYFASNLLLLILSVVGFLVAWRPGWLGGANRVLAVELYVLGMFVTLGVNVVLSFIMLGHVDDRVANLCAANSSFCDDTLLSTLQRTGEVASAFLVISLFTINTIGLRIGVGYLNVMLLFFENNNKEGAPTTVTKITPLVNGLIRWFLPGMPCIRRYVHRSGLTDQLSKHCATPCCDCRRMTSSTVGWTVMSFFLGTVLLACMSLGAVCLTTSDDVACIFSSTIVDLLELFGTHHDSLQAK